VATKLFVGNLPHSATDQSLKEFVTGAGFQITSAVVIRDKMTSTSRGFGFVELAEGEDHQRAIAGLNGQSLEGRPLTVNEAHPPRTDFDRPRGLGSGLGFLAHISEMTSFQRTFRRYSSLVFMQV
jgi:cold-inducible RNA-binding protein